MESKQNRILARKFEPYVKQQLPRMIFVFLLGTFFLLSFGSAVRESATFDEPNHLVSGYAFWRTGLYNMDLLHPPVLRLWASLPLYIIHAPWPSRAAAYFARDPWSLSYVWLFRGPWHPDRFFLPARVMVIVLGLGLGCLIWTWADQVYGKVAACASVLAYTFCPTLLAYSHYVTTDFAPVVFSTLVLYLFWRDSQQLSSRWRVFLKGVALGLAIATKFSEFILILWVGLHVLLAPREKWSWSALGLFLLAFGMTVAASYRFTQIGSLFTGLQLLRILGHASPLPHYFNGSYSQNAPLVFLTLLYLLKTPLPFLAAALAGMGLLILGRYPQPRTALYWWILPAFFYLGICSLSHYQMGIRRILILYPLLSLWIGGTVTALWAHRRWGRAVCLGMALWYMGIAFYRFPHYISYFNELAGGPENGFRYAADCNADWGQGLKELARYLHERNIGTIYLSYFGSIDPHVYGIRYVPVAPVAIIPFLGDSPVELAKEKQTLLAISVTNRVALYYKDHHLFDWLDRKHPIEKIANTIWVYDLSGDREAVARIALLRNTPAQWASPSQKDPKLQSADDAALPDVIQK